MLHFGLRCYSVDQCAMSHAQNKSTSIKSFEGKTNISAYEKALVCFPKRNVVTSNGKTVKPVCACVLASRRGASLRRDCGHCSGNARPPAHVVAVWFRVKKPDLADLASFACDRSLMTAARLERLFCITGYTSHILCIISFAILAVLPLKIKCINENQ